MNLAEFPLTVLSTRANPGIKTLEFQDTVKLKSGETIDRRWIITGADKFGLPTASDDEVILGLLKLTVDDGFRSRKVFFTRYELLKALRWTTEGRSYTRLQKALDRLSGVRIKASNGFFDNASKSHSTINFGIIDAYQINDGRDEDRNDERNSFFTWSEVLFKSFQVGFIKKLDLDFYLALKSSVTKRLYRYLDKHFWYKSRVQISLFTLAHEKIGISRTYQYVSSIRQQLDPAIEELQKLGFVDSCQYIGKGKDCEIAITAAKQPQRLVASTAEQQRSENPLFGFDRAGEGAEVSEPALEGNSNAVEVRLRTELHELLVERGIRSPQALALLRERNTAECERIRQIIAHFDKLLRSRSRLVSISPAGFLYRAVQNFNQFVLPSDGKNTKATSRQIPIAVVERETNSNPEIETLRARYLMERRQMLAKARDELEPQLLARIRRDVEGALTRIRGAISDLHFAEAVERGVEEKVAKLCAMPTFEEWRGAGRGR